MNPTAQQDIPARIEWVRTELRHCCLCPRACGVDRTRGERGFCGLTDRARCFREMVVEYEEAELNPSHQVYFAGCNLRCEFCAVLEWCEEPQAAGEMDAGILADAVKRRREGGARTLNLLGGEPSVSLLDILTLLARIDPAVRLVWNSNMYFNPMVFRALSGLVDVYLGDFKCGNDRCAHAILAAGDYVDTIKRNMLLAAEHAEVIIRHVVLPGHEACCTRPILDWISDRMPKARISLRNSYVPPARARHAPLEYPGKEDFRKVVEYARHLKLSLIS